MSDTWICDCCGGTFPKDPAWTEEEKLAEMQANIGDLPEDDRASVCDDCYEAIIGGHPPAEECVPSGEMIVFGTPHHKDKFYANPEAAPGPEPGSHFEGVCQVFDDTVEVPFNPKKAFVVKNTVDGDVFMLQEKTMEAVQGVISRQHAKLDAVAAAWLAAGSPGAHPGELVLEFHPTLQPYTTSRTVLRVKAGPYWEGGGAGPVLADVPGITLKMVED